MPAMYSSMSKHGSQNPRLCRLNVITLNYDAPKVSVRAGGGRSLSNYATRHVRVVTKARAVSADVELLD